MRYKKLFNERVKTMTEEKIMTEIKDAYQYHSPKKDTYPAWLINRVDELEEENKRYREALEFYAKKYHIAHKDMVVDYGETAREALEGESE